ncbi:MAG: hypothetical protein ACXVNO_08360 [Bacteroidia bacterium]
MLQVTMTTLLSITEKVIASLLIVWAILLCYFLIGGAWTLFELGVIQPMSTAEFVMSYHLILLLPLLTFIGGILLLFNKKSGWKLSLATLIINNLFFLIPSAKGKSVLTEKSLMIFVSALAFLSLLFFYILVRPAFRNKYNATSMTWLTIGIMAILVLADKLILYIRS